jgi:hypothetical protein
VLVASALFDSKHIGIRKDRNRDGHPRGNKAENMESSYRDAMRRSLAPGI